MAKILLFTLQLHPSLQNACPSDMTLGFCYDRYGIFFTGMIYGFLLDFDGVFSVCVL